MTESTRTKQYSFQIGLRVSHPSIDPSRITEVLNQEPTRTSRAGEPRTTLSGRVMPGTYDGNSWSHHKLWQGEWDGYHRSPQRLDDAIDAVLRDVAEHKRFFQEVRSGGGSVELTVGWFLNTDAREFFDHDLFRRMADLGVDLSLSVYPPYQEAAEPDLPQP